VWNGTAPSAGKWSPFPPAIQGPAGKYVRIPTRALEAADVFFKALSRGSELYALADRQARQQGLSGAARHAHASSLVANPTPAMLEAAETAAEQMTFTNKPHAVVGIIQQFLAAIPGGRVVVPFVRTPWNVTVAAMERTPLKFFEVAVRAAQGKLSGGRLADELAKALAGIVLAALMWKWVQEGMEDLDGTGFLITGGGPTDDRARRNLQATGWRPYAIRLGGEWWSYRRFSPVGTMVGVMADTIEGVRMARRGEDAGKVVGKITTGMIDNVLDQSFVTGLNDFLAAAMDKNNEHGLRTRYFARLERSVVPTFIRNIEEYVDPTRREEDPFDLVKGVPEPIAGAIPGLSKLVPAKTDWRGREQRADSDGSFIEAAVFPSKGMPVRTDAKLEMEFARLNYLPSPVRRSTKPIRGVEVKLTESEYRELLEAKQRATERARIVVESGAYQGLGDDELGVQQRIRMIRSAFDRELDRVRDKQRPELLRRAKEAMSARTN
jgi:hypothetical protein